MRGLVAWCLFVMALIFMAADVARWQVTGLFLLGVVVLVIWAWLIGVFTRGFWIADANTSERLSHVDEGIDRQSQPIDWDGSYGYGHAHRLTASPNTQIDDPPQSTL